MGELSLSRLGLLERTDNMFFTQNSSTSCVEGPPCVLVWRHRVPILLPHVGVHDVQCGSFFSLSFPLSLS